MLWRAALEVRRAEGQQLFDGRFLTHGVDKACEAQMHLTQFARCKCVKQHFRRAEHGVEARCITQASCLRYNLRTCAVHEAQTLAADRDHLDLFTLRLQLFDLDSHCAQDVGVHTTAQTFVCRHHNEANRFGIFIGTHECVGVFWVCAAEVSRDLTHFFGIRAGRTHAVLRLTHF